MAFQDGETDVGVPSIQEIRDMLTVSGLSRMGAYSQAEQLSVATVLEFGRRGHFLEKLQLMIEQDLQYQLNQETEVITLGRTLQQRPFWGLEYLVLSNNRVEEFAMTQLLKAIEIGNLSNLRELHLYKSHVDAAGAKLLAAALMSGHLSNLEFLELSQNNIQDSGLIAISHALSSGKVPLLKILSIGEEPQSEGFRTQGATALALAFQSGQVPLLEVLRLWSIVDEQGVIAIIRALETSLVGQFQVLDLSVCELGVEASRALAKALQAPRFNSLSFFSVCDSPSMGDEGVIILLNALKMGSYNNLRTLHLSNLCMRDGGWAELTTILEAGHLPGLTWLYGEDDVSLSRASAQALANAYQNNTSLVAKPFVTWPDRSFKDEVDRLRKENSILIKSQA